ncbi:hypothetical protein [Pseudooceanicola algae]|uniref:Uncharacterized protein n=1 Tax=Pseudooceanicola algae TaxID=1537215 RepID=A0A418SK46_9RHOB|nr:hypothetical protein [Pseudooceanicola algae]QPM89160.1 hypothetical protein PSAL_003710 [Pseudooceanicola algae]
MPNIHDCLQRAVDAGELDQVRAREAGSKYDQLVERYATEMPRHQAEATAAAHLKEATKRARRSRKHAVLNQLQAMTRIRTLILDSPDPALAIRNLIEFSEGSGFRGESVASIEKAYVHSINASLNSVLRETGRNVWGNSRDAVRLRDVIRELHMEETGDARAKALAQKVRSEQQRMRRLFNAHGGDIGELADFGVNHTHDVARLRAAGLDAWKDFVAPQRGPHMLDWTRIIDNATGKPFSADGTPPPRDRIDSFLNQIHEGITTRGWDTREAGLTTGGKALYNQRAEHRVLHFRDGSTWLEYNKRFGSSDPFSGMIGGLHGMARDVAMMRVLGPNPHTGLEFAIQVAEKHAAIRKDPGLEDRVSKTAIRARTMLMHIDGSANVPESLAASRFFGGTRKVLTSIQLGSAALSAVTDLATTRMAATVMGMNPNNLFARQVQMMTSHATRETAAQMGYVADTLADIGSTAARFTGEVPVGEFADRLSGFTMRASGLSFWTDMNRTAFQMEFSGFMASHAGDRFEALPDPLRRIFETRGITARDWDLLRDPEALFTAPNGATFLSPIYWRNAQKTLPPAEAEGLAMRLQMAIEEQLEVAIPSATVEGRALMVGRSAPGAIGGELLRSTAMYKGFAVSLMLAQIRRFMAIPTPLGRAAYAFKMSASLVLMGALAVQLKEMAKGNDPRPMDESKFWMAAVFQSGGLGIFGDFFASETSRVGGGLAETIAGPVVGFAGDLIGPVASNIQRAAEGEDLLLGRDAANLVRYDTPIGSSLWYARLAFSRGVADQLQYFLDPEAERQWRQQARRQEQDYGNANWWQRGQLVPDRAPDLSNAFGGSR